MTRASRAGDPQWVAECATLLRRDTPSIAKGHGPATFGRSLCRTRSLFVDRQTVGIWRIGVVHEAETSDASLSVGERQRDGKGWAYRSELLFDAVIPTQADSRHRLTTLA